MDNEIIQIARECGFLQLYGSTVPGHAPTLKELERFYREAQRRAFEKAAKVCEARMFIPHNIGFSDCASAIRQLGEQ